MRKMFCLVLLAGMMMATAGGTMAAINEESNLLKYTVVPMYLTGMSESKTSIPADCQDTLTKLAEIATAKPDVTFVAKGLCSVEGSENYNLALALRRAEVVKNFLVSKGVEPERIRTVGLGRVAAVNRADVRGVLLEIIYIPRSIRIDISAVEAARLSAIAAAGRTAAAEAEAKAWAAEAKAQADRAEGFAVSANLSAEQADTSARQSAAKANWAEFQADRAEDERKKAEAIAKALEEKDVSPAVPVVVQETASTTSGWLKSIGIGGNAPDYGFVSVQTKFLAVTIAGADGFYGAGVTYRLMNRIEISALVSREKYEKAWAEMRNLQAIYTIPVTDKISVGLGADYGVIRPFSANDAKISGKIFSPLVKAGVELGAGWVLGANYAPRFLSLSSDELSRDAKADEFSLTIAKLFLLGGGGKNE